LNSLFDVQFLLNTRTTVYDPLAVFVEKRRAAFVQQ